MSVLEARGEPLYLAGRCAPCTAWALLRPTRPWRGRGPPEDLVCAPFYVLRLVLGNGTTPRRDSPGGHVYYFNVEASPEI